MRSMPLRAPSIRRRANTDHDRSSAISNASCLRRRQAIYGYSNHQATMDCETQALTEALRKAPKVNRPASLTTLTKELAKRTALAPDAPAPALNAMVAEHGAEPTAQALEAYNARLAGHTIVDVAHQMGVSINLAKSLIRQAHDAICEDLKSNLEVNRTLDLGRIDAILSAHLPAATGGDTDSAKVVLRALTHRAKLTGAEPLPDPGRSNPQNVLVWIQSQLPSINRIVDSLPAE